jgi:Tol biopolymer transport system component
MSKLVAVGLVLVVAAALLSGCSGSNNQTIFQWVLERVSYNQAATRVAFTSLGGNGVRYVYSITSSGGNLSLLTPTDNDQDLTDEGGKQPAWSPDGADLAIVGRRGGTQSIILIDPATGAGRREALLTSDNVAVPGADAQPSWKADSTQLVYVSTKNSPTGRWEIRIINRDGTGDTLIARTNDTNDAQWPVFSPDGMQIIYQSRIGNLGVDTSLRVLEIATGVTTPIGDTEGNNFREEGPSVVDPGTGPVVAFSSNRNGDFDIWTVNLDGTGAVALTDDSRSDGLPVWAADASRIAFTRDSEVWTMAADGTDQKQLTERFQSR